MPADLHVHTNFSDGIYSPEEIVKKAKKADLSAVAITDHDCVDGIDPALAEGKKLGVKVIPGIEFTTDLPDTEVHILGYYIDHHAPWLLELLKKIRDARVDRIYKIVEKLKSMGLKIEPEDVLKLSDKGSVGRPHVARAMVNKGIVRNIQEAFNRYLDCNSPAYVPHYNLSPYEAVEVIKQAGGIPVYAHPGISSKDDIIPELVAKGMKGIEVYYSKHSDLQVKHYLALTKQYDLLATGGSDFHGSLFREGNLGEVTLADEEFRKFEAYHNGTR
jgi:3',5'-nucleoside bisphosphate phosphatase